MRLLKLKYILLSTALVFSFIGAGYWPNFTSDEIFAYNLNNLYRSRTVNEQGLNEDEIAIDGRIIVDKYGFERFEKAF